jgi:hypothetical protein
MTLGKMTHSIIMTLNIIIISIMTVSIGTLQNATLSVMVECCFAERHVR